MPGPITSWRTWGREALYNRAVAGDHNESLPGMDLPWGYRRHRRRFASSGAW